MHISGLATLQLGYTVFGPVPPLEPLASLALTTLGLGLQGVGLSMSYLGGQMKIASLLKTLFQALCC